MHVPSSSPVAFFFIFSCIRSSFKVSAEHIEACLLSVGLTRREQSMLVRYWISYVFENVLFKLCKAEN